MPALATTGPRTTAPGAAPRWVTTVVRPAGSFASAEDAAGVLGVVHAGAALGGTVLVDLSACDVLPDAVRADLGRAAVTAERAGGILLVVDPGRRHDLPAEVVRVEVPPDPDAVPPAAATPVPPLARDGRS